MQHVSPIEDFPTEKFELLIKIMQIAPFIAVKHAFPIMKKQKYGRIINVASINGLVGFAGKAAYNSAKHGVIGLTKVAALEGLLTELLLMRFVPVMSIPLSYGINYKTWPLHEMYHLKMF